MLSPFDEESNQATSRTISSTSSAKRHSRFHKVPDVRYIDDPKNSLLPRIQLTTATVERSLVSRLTNPPRWITTKRTMEEIVATAMEEHPVSPRCIRYAKLGADDMEEYIDRLYTKGIANMKTAKDRAVAKYHQEDPNVKQLSAEEMEDSVDRLYVGDVEKRKDRKEELEAKYYPSQEEPRVMAGDEVEESVRRLYDAADQRNQKIEMLSKKYCFQRPKSKKLDGDTIKTVSDRLYRNPKPGK